MGFELFWNQVITLDTVTQQQILEQFAHEAKLLQISSATTEEGISRSYSYQLIPRAAWPDDLFVSLEAGKAYLLFHSGHALQRDVLQQLLTSCLHRHGAAGEFIED